MNTQCEEIDISIDDKTIKRDLPLGLTIDDLPLMTYHWDLPLMLNSLRLNSLMRNARKPFQALVH